MIPISLWLRCAQTNWEPWREITRDYRRRIILSMSFRNVLTKETTRQVHIMTVEKEACKGGSHNGLSKIAKHGTSREYNVPQNSFLLITGIKVWAVNIQYTCLLYPVIRIRFRCIRPSWARTSLWWERTPMLCIYLQRYDRCLFSNQGATRFHSCFLPQKGGSLVGDRRVCPYNSRPCIESHLAFLGWFRQIYPSDSVGEENETSRRQTTPEIPVPAVSTQKMPGCFQQRSEITPIFSAGMWASWMGILRKHDKANTWKIWHIGLPLKHNFLPARNSAACFAFDDKLKNTFSADIRLLLAKQSRDSYQSELLSGED